MKEDKWNYWTNRSYYHKELRERAKGLKDEMEAAKHIANLVASKTDSCDSIIDVGCGTGHFILSLEKTLTNPFAYHGVDITHQHIVDANEIFADKEEYTFEVGDIRALPISDKQYEVAICSNTIPHIPNVDKAIQELIRVTKNDVFIRMLIGNETLIAKKALSEEFDQNGEPTSFMYVNIYAENWLRKVVGEKYEVAIYEDEFDKDRIMKHYREHSKIAGHNIATKIVDDKQFKGYLMLPWKVVHIKLR